MPYRIVFAQKLSKTVDSVYSPVKLSSLDGEGNNSVVCGHWTNVHVHVLTRVLSRRKVKKIVIKASSKPHCKKRLAISCPQLGFH